MNPIVLPLLLVAGAVAIFSKPAATLNNASPTTGPVIDGNKNLEAMLATIRWAEGTADEPDPYAVVYGFGAPFGDFADHPIHTGQMQPVDGPDGPATSAGAYQITVTTWDGLGGKATYGDFSPNSQDQAARDLIARRGATILVQTGQIKQALSRLSYEWASLPPKRYNQGTKTQSDVLAAFVSNGGVLSNGQ